LGDLAGEISKGAIISNITGVNRRIVLLVLHLCGNRNRLTHNGGGKKRRSSIEGRKGGKKKELGSFQ